MVTRNMRCVCGFTVERTGIGMNEPSRFCSKCGKEMMSLPTTVAGFKFRGPGFHCVDYPKSNEQLKKDYGLVEHDSTNPNADYHQEGYAEEMVSKVPGTRKPKGDGDEEL